MWRKGWYMLEFQNEERLKKETGTKTAEHRLATVTAVSGTKMQLQFDGESSASDKYYRGIAAVSVGGRVLCARVAGTYVVLGELL